MSHREYLYLKGLAAGLGNTETLKALNAAKLIHANQTRKGDGEPYLYHLVRVTAHLAALGIKDDNILAVAVLHDAVEDGCYTYTELSERFNINIDIAYDSYLLSKNGLTTDAYYERFRENPDNIAPILVKIADRCHNISTMGDAFTDKKMKEYIKETRDYVIPLCKYAKDYYPAYSDQVYAMKYHIESICNTIEAIMKSR